MALHPDFPESPHEIIDMTQGIPPFNPLGVLDIHCVPLEQTVGYLSGGKIPTLQGNRGIFNTWESGSI